MEESGRPSRGRSQAAYTDIDGTVTAYNTIFEFLRFDAAERSCEAEAEDLLAGLRSAAGNGVPRSATNARYFCWWRGRSVAEVDELGERWADAQAESPEEWPFLEPVTSLLDAHTRSGRRIVAVTASFEPALVRVPRGRICGGPVSELRLRRPPLGSSVHGAGGRIAVGNPHGEGRAGPNGLRFATQFSRL